MFDSRHVAMASGWIPYIICTVLCVIFSTFYVLWYRSNRAQEKCRTTTCVAVLSLVVTLMGSCLVPVDVFLVSYMKYSNGTYKDWAEDPEVRRSISVHVMYTYYAFYGIILSFVFLVLPLNFFFHAIGEEETDDEVADGELREESCSRRFCRAFKYTLASLFLLGLLVALGMFLPFNDDTPHHGIKELDHLFEEELDSGPDRGENLLLFLLNILNVIGMVLIIIYTSYGMCILPCGMVAGYDTVYTEISNADKEIEDVERQIREAKAELLERGDNMTELEANYLDRLERQLRMLNRTRFELEQTSRSFVNRCILICRPFQLVLGAFFSMFGFMIFLSLLLTSVDKAMNSLGPRSGYVLRNSTLPNPVDIVLVWAQTVFPLDYIVYCGMILFFVFSSMAGLRKIGIRFMWLSVYKIRPHKTKPQAILLMCLNLMIILLALNVVMYSVVPDYTAYGSQHYMANTESENITSVIKKCDHYSAPVEKCDMTRIAVILLAFSYKAWIFGAAYYWLVWGFLIAVFVGSTVALFKVRRRNQERQGESERLLDDDEDAVFSASAPEP